jgi:hypothetical protein
VAYTKLAEKLVRQQLPKKTRVLKNPPAAMEAVVVLSGNFCQSGSGENSAGDFYLRSSSAFPTSALSRNSWILFFA